MCCCALCAGDDEPIYPSRFATACLALGGICNVDTRCEFHHLHQASDELQDNEISGRTKRGSLRKHLSTGARSSGYECFCLKRNPNNGSISVKELIFETTHNITSVSSVHIDYLAKVL